MTGPRTPGLGVCLFDRAADLGAWFRDYVYAVRWIGAGVLRRHDRARYRSPDPDAPTVVLIPGIYESWTFLRPLADLLGGRGYDVHPVPELRHNAGTIEQMAEVVDRYLRREGIERCVLVAHSKGGLIGKRLLAENDGTTEITGLVAVNTPFNGSVLAWLLPLPAIRVFRPQSPELAALAASSHVNGRIVSVYGRFDPHIPGGSALDGARNIRLETRGHFLPLSDPLVHAAILSGIEGLAGCEGRGRPQG